MFTWRADRRARRLEQRDAFRLEKEIIEVLEARQAQLNGEYLNHNDIAGRRVYTFRITNSGKDIAKKSFAVLIDRYGDPVPVLEQTPGGKADERARKPLPRVFTAGTSTDVELSVNAEALKRGPLSLHFEWSDRTGPERQERSSEVEVPT